MGKLSNGMGKLSNGMGKLSNGMGNLTGRQKIGIALLVALSVILVIVLIVYALSDDDKEVPPTTDGSSPEPLDGGHHINNCIPPDPVTAGYDISNVTGSLNKDSFSITGVECATGYTGTASANACSVAGQAYTLTGCSVTESGGSGGGSINNCDANEPDLTDSNMNTITANSCDGTDIGGTCVHTCNDGYTGGSVTCQADGTWAVAPCTLSATTQSATTCSDNPCGTGATCTDNAGGTGYTCSCNAGFYGVSTTNAPANCTEMTCSDTDGSGAAASCGDGATCSDGGTGDGYTCSCNAGFNGDSTNNEPANCTTTVGGVAEVTPLVESAGEWYVGGGNSQSDADDRKDCHSFCAKRGKVCSENTTADKFSSDTNLVNFLETISINPEFLSVFSNIITQMREKIRGGEVACSGSQQSYSPIIRESARTGDNNGAKFFISTGTGTCSRKLYSGANPDDLIPLSCGDGRLQASPYRINVCKCRDP